MSGSIESYLNAIQLNFLTSFLIIWMIQLMKLNCFKIIVSAFKLEETVFATYYDLLRQSLFQTLPPEQLQFRLKLVTEEQFVKELLAQSQNVGICFAPIGMVESSYLNKIKGVRAAIVHNKYIAEMCRKHNDCNVCVIGVDCIGVALSASIAVHFLHSAFDNEERNMLRLGKIRDFEDSIPYHAAE